MYTKNVCKKWGTFASPSVNFNNFRGPRVRFLPDIQKNENFEISIISNLVSGTFNFFVFFFAAEELRSTSCTRRIINTIAVGRMVQTPISKSSGKIS